jgi:hypothetical protein
MTWYSADAWAWCGVLVNVLAVTVFLGILIAIVVLAIRVHGEGRSDRAARRDGGFARVGQAAVPPGAQGDMGNDDFSHRLM